MPNYWWRFLALSCCVVASSVLAQSMETGSREDGRTYWRWGSEGLGIQLTQLQPDQIRAFYLARGLSRTAVEQLAKTCFFQMEVRNSRSQGTPPIHLPLSAWRLVEPTGSRTVLLVTDWLQKWGETTVSGPARIAFRWALFPARQTFHAGDRNWGMLSTGLETGSVFDLDVLWQSGEEQRTVRMQRLRCADGG